MGKWTPTHYDDVLVSKIKSLVSGAIERSKLEKTEPLISYESFVEELDARDSFTTSVVEILVKELAERRARGSGQDGGVIADRTAKSLRTLSNSIRIYRSGSRRHVSRRTLPGALTEYLSSPPHEMGMDDDDEDFRSMLDMTNGSSAIEGARVNSDLYEAYGGGSGQHSSWAGSGLVFSNGIGRRHSLSPLSASTDERGSPPPARAFSPISLPPSPPTMRRSPPARMFPTPAASISSSNVARIRRPQPHSRTVDFSQFSSRRRSLNREAAENSASREESGTTQATSTTRRFFPFSRFQPSRWGVSRIWSDIGEDEPHESSTGEPTPSSPAWNSAVYPPMLTADEIERYSSESVREPWIPPHTLRRGGIRAPESMLSRHASPVPGPTTAPETGGPSSSSAPNNAPDHDSDPAPVGYPTPGSAAGHESS